MARLLNIPLEVLFQITSYLTTREYGFLRGTCKELEASLFGAFASEFFSKKQFALIEFSIQVLVDIAKSRLGPSLTHIIIHLEHPHHSKVVGDTYNVAVSRNQYLAECLNHAQFISTGLDVEMLSEAIRHLPNLETIGMRDFRSKKRSRDDTVWNSYGCPEFERKTNRALVIPRSPFMYSTAADRGPEYTSHVFLTILRALGNAAVSGCNPKLTRLEVLLHFCRFQDEAFKIPDHLDAQISPMLGKFTAILLDNLTECSLSDNLSESSLSVAVDHICGKNKPTIAVGFFLSRFLEKAPALEQLRLNFQAYHHPNSIPGVLGWLTGARPDCTDPRANPIDSLPLANASDSLPCRFPPTPDFSKLNALDIGMAQLQESDLLALYERYKSTLRCVSLHKVTLSSPNGKKTSSNPWARLCEKMAEADLNLELLKLSYLRHISLPPRSRRGYLTFRDSKQKHVKIWRGSAFAQSAKDIIDEMDCQWDKFDDVDDDENMDIDEDGSSVDDNDD